MVVLGQGESCDRLLSLDQPSAHDAWQMTAWPVLLLKNLDLGQEPRQTTSNVGHLKKSSIQALIHGLNRHYYSMVSVLCRATSALKDTKGDRLPEK